MRCLYEILAVEHSADDGAIRSAYRKLALRYHPDKNQEDPESAEEKFKEIQNAYEILSDKHERAWYDSHRDAILRSGERHQAGSGAGEPTGQRPEDFVDVYAYFTSTCYSGFGDGPRGFYSVYDALFRTLAAQEAAASADRAQRRGGDSGVPLPHFGSSETSWSEVSAFYAAWGSFATKKDFAWADTYNPASAPNRKVRRAVEQENEKVRRATRKEYNEGVRALVDFVKKRDKRVAMRQVEEAKRRQEREAAAAARREAERQERLARAARYEVAEWARSEASSDAGSDGAIEDEILWYCPACEKHFKSEASLRNHEKSKKHREQVELLRALLQDEEDIVNVDMAGPSNSTMATNVKISPDKTIEEEENDEQQRSEESAASTDESEEPIDPLDARLTAEDITSDDASDDNTVDSSLQSSDFGDREEDEEMNEDAMLASLLQSHNLRASARNEGNFSDDASDEEDNLAEIAQQAEDTLIDDEVLPHAAIEKSNGKGKAEQKSKRRQKKRHELSHSKSNGQGPVQDGVCSTCSRSFPSRNQLFKHIKETGHAELKLP